MIIICMPYEADKHEKEILEFWEKNKIFEKSVESRPDNKPYVFYDGPPFATGLPHYGHILSSVIKDVVPRYWTMKGYRVRRRWGWDCHGLPIESLIEKELKISGKKDIEEKIGVKEFNEACRSKVLMYTSEWKKMVDRIGRWVEFDNAYKTMDVTYMESVWWALKTMWDKSLIYEGRKVLMYCPRCETPVSKAEVAMDHSYKDVTEDAVTVKFRVKSHKSKVISQIDGPVYLLAWTTTPWTLPGNVALAVGEELDYVIIRLLEKDEIAVIAEERLLSVIGDQEYEVIKQVKGKDLVGFEYEPLFDMPAMRESGKKAYYVAAGDFVTTDEGTGIVHTAVIYGEDDYQLGLKIDLPMVPMLDSKGHYNEVAPEFIQGRYYKQAEKDIKQYLQDNGLLFAREPHTHSYPHCWRCETPLIYNAVSSWFINIQKVKDRMIELNERVNWFPEHLKHGRFLNIVKEAPDWNISRNRYWATALPFWKSEDGDVICVGSIQELEELSGQKVTDLHRDVMDEVVINKNGKIYHRVPEVLDSWVEAASMPFAEWHYPFENKETFEKRFPGQYIAEYIAQTRTWFYYMHTIAVILFDNISFENVVTTGTILNEKGEKLSKSKRNFTDPWVIIEQYGMDALRYYLMTSVVMQAENVLFKDGEVKDVYNKVINLLWNVVEFYKMYADENQESVISNQKSAHVLDRWILARLNQLVSEVTTHMDNYDTVRAGRPIKDFIDDLSTWYIRRSRDRFKSNDETDKEAAITTLREVLLTLAKIMAPFMPFMAEKIYQNVKCQMSNVKCSESVHLETWPEAGEIDAELLGTMAIVRSHATMGLRLRKEKGINVRQPLSNFWIKHDGEAPKYWEECKTILADELNVKEVLLKDEGQDSPPSDFDWTITPQLKQEGYVREIVRAINQMRKEQKLTPDQGVRVTYHTDDAELAEVFVKYAEDIKRQTRAAGLEEGDGAEVEIGGKKVRIGISY